MTKKSDIFRDETNATEPPEAPPNTRVPSPQHEIEMTRLPYAEPIPGEYINMATPWIEVGFETNSFLHVFEKNGLQVSQLQVY
jgi:hypothetical protein